MQIAEVAMDERSAWEPIRAWLELILEKRKREKRSSQSQPKRDT
jgi:hypothetical protein